MVAGISVGVVVLIPVAVQGQQTPVVVSGQVTAEGGGPIPGVQVYIPQLTYGAITGENGNYQFSVPAGRVHGQTVTLSARAIGHRPQTVPIVLTTGQPIRHDFTLAAAPVQLSEVVVTGEGIVTTTEKLGNRVDQVRSEDITKSNEPNVVEALAAKAPNIQIQSQSGDPGSSVSMQIRGIKTLTGDAQPLFVVDGIPLDNSTINTENVFAGYAGQGVVAPNRISDLNPEDIESVNILKGAAAAAIYGARAAQGVVLITTKSGKPGATRYSLRSSLSFDNVSQGYALQTLYGEGNNGLAQGVHGCTAISCMGRFSWGPRLDPDSFKVALAQSGACKKATNPTACAAAEFQARFPTGIHTYDHFGELFQTGHIFDNTLSISGGDDRRTFYLSAGRMSDQGFVVGPNNSYDRNTVRVKATQMLGGQLRLTGNVSYVDTRGSYIQRGNNVSGIMLGGLRTPPEFDNHHYIDPKTGQHRSYRFPNPYPGSELLSRGFDNPFFTIYDQPSTSSLSRVYGDVDLDYNPWSWLTLKYTGGADYYTDERLEVFPHSSSSQPDGLINRASFTNYILDHNLVAIANHDFTSSLTANLTVGQNLNASNYRQIYVTGVTLLTPQPFKLTNTVSYNPNDDQTIVHRESYFAQLGIDLYKQLFLTAAVRSDASSAFAQNSRRHTFPKASAAWTWSDLLGNFGNRLDFGKARLAYGVTGREPAPYSTLNAYNVGQYYEYGGVGYLKTVFRGQGGLVSSTVLGNSNLKPERTAETEGGIDIGLFGGLTDLSVTAYRSRTTDVIFALPQPPSSGYFYQIANAAEISNRGAELQWNLHPIRGPELAWDFGILWGQNNNRLERLNGPQEVGVGSGAIIGAVARPGYAVGAFEGFDFARCRYHEASNIVGSVDINAYCHAHNAPDGALYIDSNGFPITDPTNRILGWNQPRWQGAVHNTITFHKVQLSALVDIRRGGTAYDGTRGALNAYGTEKDTEIRGQTRTFGKDYGERVVTGPGAGKPVVIDQNWFQGNGGTFGDVSSPFIEDASFVKLREISVAYTFDLPWIRSSLGMSSVGVRLSGRNLHTWTKYRGIDPEFNLEGAGLVQGVDWFNNPQTRSIVATVTLNR
jgi:TonB-linked SusC/RagA family outer membrane protein